jgi:hypothetical protein
MALADPPPPKVGPASDHNQFAGDNFQRFMNPPWSFPAAGGGHHCKMLASSDLP